MYISGPNQAHLVIIGNHQSFANRMNLLKPLADSMEKAILFEDVEAQQYEEYIRKAQKFVPLRISADASVEDTENRLTIMTRYGVEILKTIKDDADKNKASISQNLDVVTKVLDCKREYLEKVTLRGNEVKRQISTQNGLLAVETSRKNRLQEELESWRDTRRDFEIARDATWICLPCLAGFSIKIADVDSKINSLGRRIYDSQTSISQIRRRIQAYQQELDSLPSKSEMEKLKNDIYEVNGLKNIYSTTIDNLKALKQVTRNIDANAKKASAMIEGCGNNIDECYTIVPIRDAIAKLKREGKSFWDYLQNSQNPEDVDIPVTICPSEGQGCPVNELMAFRKKPQKARKQCFFQ